jgi:alpha-2-macroglobulin
MTRIRSLLTGARRVWNVLRRTGSRWLVALVGRLEWQAPTWLSWVGRHSRRGWRNATATRGRIAALAAVLIAATGAGVWWYTRPTPHYVTYSVNPPGLTEYDDKGISSIKPLSVVFSESVAPLQQIQKAVTTGITMSPSVAGVWSWTTDK